MADTAVQTHLERLHKPLHYAMRHNFAQLATLRDLEPYVHHHVQALYGLTLPPDLPPLLQQLAQTLCGFDSLPLPQKQMRLRQADTLLSQMHATLAAAPPATVAPPPVADPLAQPVQYLRGVGPKRAALLEKLQLRTVNDLLWCLPLRYEDRRHPTPLGLLQVGRRQTFCGTVADMQTYAGRRGKPFVALTLQDDSGPLTCKWFQMRGTYLQERFPPGAYVVGSGVVTLNSYTSSREVVHPDLEVIEADDTDLVHFGRLVPIYPLTAGLHQKTMRTLMKTVVEVYVPHVPETLPETVRQTHHLPSLPEALRQVHFPDADIDLQLLNTLDTPFHQRLIFEEFFLLELGLALRHRVIQQERRALPYQQPNHLGETLLRHLPFHLTAAQHRVLFEVLADMQRPFPMNRLIQGDVGSGKTVVALLAMLMAVSNGFQAALMAPTEILAEQHLHTLRDLLRPLDLEVALVTSAVKGKSRQRLLQDIAQGKVALIVGTHALIYNEVHFHQLGMIVVDEQHRFGVLQRARLRSKGLTPDVLVMTATPIPRTLSMTLYGDLDLSVIDELPPGRLPVSTQVLSASRRERTYEIVRREVQKGHQAYIVYPVIEESESLDVSAAVEMAARLQQEVFPEYRLGLLHGRLAGEEKEAIMRAFTQGELPILVCTTVIEVGVDVPNATVMVIENAERFGLAQLHQLRGRVGRGQAQSACLLIAGHRLSKEGRQRLQVIQDSTDGFYVAEQDLQIRGPGELLGTKQAGLPELHVGNLLHHGLWLEQARQAAFALIDTDPDLTQPVHRALLHAMRARWRDRLELAAVG
jgi:ATP-dependent DNA helicase RecG